MTPDVTSAPCKKKSKKRAVLSRERLEELFLDIKRLYHQEPSVVTGKRRRNPKKQTVEEMPQPGLPEAQAKNHIKDDASPAPEQEIDIRESNKSKRIGSTPILYEKEQVGFAYKDNEIAPLDESKHKDESSENAIQAPLIITGKPLGKMKIELSPGGSLDKDDETLISTIAEQVSLQIQSLRLLEDAERARAEAEAATRRFMHESWQSYLDAIHQDERIGYSYDQTEVTPFLDEAKFEAAYQETVRVMDQQVGTIELEDDPDSPLSEEDKKLVAAVADQVAQQVETIRLLADASRARAEAEEATRRLTRENWQGYVSQGDTGPLGFQYDTVKVSPYKESYLPENTALTIPLEVRGEDIGQLAVVKDDSLSPDALELAKSIASQTSTHLETLRLTEELQKRAQELLELDRLKSGFLANMSHELRTPLNSILGFADVILMELDGPLTPEMNDDLKLIQKNGQHLLNLINDVLDMAKIESGRMNLNPVEFLVHDVLEEVNSITSTLASERDILLFIEDDSDRKVEIFADNTRLRQVMINLVNNAIKFTEEGGKIAIRAARQPNDNVLITIKDTGVGIPKDQLDDIFQEFTQVDTSTTRKVGGTGLGLPISRRLIEMHGGRLWAESTGIPGEGSTFFVELPLKAQIKEDVIERIEK